MKYFYLGAILGTLLILIIIKYLFILLSLVGLITIGYVFLKSKKQWKIF